MSFKSSLSKYLLVKTFAVASLLTLSTLSTAEMVVIVNPQNSVESLSASQVRKIYLGRSKSFPDGTKVKAFELSSDSETRKAFLKSILRKDEGSLSAYWARMMFSGRALPPKSFPQQGEVRNAVATNVLAIGFIDSSAVDSTVKVIQIK